MTGIAKFEIEDFRLKIALKIELRLENALIGKARNLQAPGA
jgi:hypothetical protein